MPTSACRTGALGGTGGRDGCVATRVRSSWLTTPSILSCSLPARRTALTCCCRELWAQQQVADSPTLWGDVDLFFSSWGAAGQPEADAPSLAAWLARRCVLWGGLAAAP